LKKEILVYPHIEPTDEALEILPLVRGEWESFVRGRGSDLYRIREYMPEDSARHVDWKATAKSGSMKVREFAREDERKLCIVFDNPAAGAITEAAYENAVDLAASLAWHFSTLEAEVCFILPGHPRTRDLHEFLAWLAVVEPVKGSVRTESAEDVLRADGVGNSDDYKIVVTARQRGTIPVALWNSSYFVFVGENETANTRSAIG
jgi:uncharacterized protein (DUF58 family)